MKVKVVQVVCGGNSRWSGAQVDPPAWAAGDTPRRTTMRIEQEEREASGKPSRLQQEFIRQGGVLLEPVPPPLGFR